VIDLFHDLPDALFHRLHVDVRRRRDAPVTQLFLNVLEGAASAIAGDGGEPAPEHPQVDLDTKSLAGRLQNPLQPILRSDGIQLCAALSAGGKQPGQTIGHRKSTDLDQFHV
jgi:hypothetical protein